MRNYTNTKFIYNLTFINPLREKKIIFYFLLELDENFYFYMKV
jgi:hypothetical protein